MQLLRSLRAEGLMVLSASVGGVSVTLGPSYGTGTNVTTRPAQTVLDAYGSPGIIAALEGEDADEDVVALKS